MSFRYYNFQVVEVFLNGTDAFLYIYLWTYSTNWDNSEISKTQTILKSLFSAKSLGKTVFEFMLQISKIFW